MPGFAAPLEVLPLVSGPPPVDSSLLVGRSGLARLPPEPDLPSITDPSFSAVSLLETTDLQYPL